MTIIDKKITIMTFGFKYGLPNANYYFDVSFIKNPARQHNWSLFSSVDDEMSKFILSQKDAQIFIEKILPLIKSLYLFDDDVRIAFGCSSGRHRSVVIANEIERLLQKDSIKTKIIHREF